MSATTTTFRNGEPGAPPAVRSVAAFLDAPLLEQFGHLPLAHVAASGEVTHVNAAGREVWGQLDGVRLPEALLASLRTRQSGALEPLPLPVGGMRVLTAPSRDDDGWLLVGYADTGAWRIEQLEGDTVAQSAPVALLRLRGDGVVIYANPEAERLIGEPCAQMIGRTFGLELLFPEDRHRFTSALRAARRDGASSTRVRVQRPAGELARFEIRLTHVEEIDEVTAVLLDVTEHDEVTSALLQSEALYQTFLEQSPVGIVHLDREGVVTFENYRLRALTGEEPDAAWIGRRLHDVEGIDPRLVQLTSQMLEKGQSFGAANLTFTRACGAVRAVSVHGAPIRHPEQGTVGAALMVFDVTAEREREQELRTRRRYDSAEPALRNAALSLPTEHAFLDEAARILGETAGADQVFVLLAGEDADAYEEEVRWASEPERSLVPLRIDGPQGTLLADASSSLQSWNDRQPGPAGEARQQLLASLGATDALALPFSTTAERRGVLLLTRVTGDDNWSPAEHQALSQLAALFETLWGWMRAEARYREVVTTIEDSLYAFAFDSRGARSYSLVTRQMERLTGLTPTELLSGTISWKDDVVHPDDRGAVDAFERALREGREVRLVYRVNHRDGSVRWLRESSTPSRDPAGRLVVGGIVSDVTDQKEVEQSLMQAKQDAEAANRMKSTFLATMSHELRTPLGAIKGFSELLQEEVAELPHPSPEIVEFADVIRTNATKVLRLVSDLLDLAKLQTDRLALDRAPVALHAIVRPAADRHRARLAERGITLEEILASGDPIVQADMRRLDQVLEIVLSNADKFTEEGTVTVRTSNGDDGLAVAISDTGIGIAEEHLPRIFEPFMQEDNRLNRAYEGSGLGLALAQRLVLAMGGSIDVASKKGEGTTVSIVLPHADA
jgi:PAS domain S-box-containing protein